MKRCKGCGGFGRGLVKAHGYCLYCSRVLNKPPPGGYPVETAEAAPAAPAHASHAHAHAPPAVVRSAPAPVAAAAAFRSSSAVTRPPSGMMGGGRGGGGRGAGGRGRGRGRRPPPMDDVIDPMDPSSYSDAPRGGWCAPTSLMRPYGASQGATVLQWVLQSSAFLFRCEYWTGASHCVKVCVLGSSQGGGAGGRAA